MRDTSLFQKAPEGCPGETPSFWISTRGLLATDDSTSFPPGWTIHQPFRPLQQRQIQLHANPPAPPFISFCRGKKHPHQPMQQKNTTHPTSSHLGMLGGQDTLLCLGWKGDVWSLGKKKGQEREAEPQQEVEGQEWGQGQGWAGSPGCVVLHSTREDQGFSPGGLEPVSLLDQELSRKCYLHRTQQRFNTTLYTQNHYMLTRWVRLYIYCTLKNRKKQYLQKTL